MNLKKNLKMYKKCIKIYEEKQKKKEGGGNKIFQNT